jgi:hypothetical protein
MASTDAEAGHDRLDPAVNPLPQDRRFAYVADVAVRAMSGSSALDARVMTVRRCRRCVANLANPCPHPPEAPSNNRCMCTLPSASVPRIDVREVLTQPAVDAGGVGDRQSV